MLVSWWWYSDIRIVNLCWTHPTPVIQIIIWTYSVWYRVSVSSLLFTLLKYQYNHTSVCERDNIDSSNTNKLSLVGTNFNRMIFNGYWYQSYHILGVHTEGIIKIIDIFLIKFQNPIIQNNIKVKTMWISSCLIRTHRIKILNLVGITTRRRGVGKV